MNFKEFLKSGTYISVTFDEETNGNLREFAESLDLVPIDNFHCTVCYSKVSLDVMNVSNSFEGTARITGIEYLGDIDSEYRAIVLNIESEEIQKLHNLYIKEYNYKHQYPEFKQHISLAYKPREDIDLSKVELPTFKINIVKEKIKPLTTS